MIRRRHPRGFPYFEHRTMADVIDLERLRDKPERTPAETRRLRELVEQPEEAARPDRDASGRFA